MGAPAGHARLGAAGERGLLGLRNGACDRQRLARAGVSSKKWETDANFERLHAHFCMRNHELLRPALGSHNVRSLAHGIAVARFLGLAASGLEIQMLYGMADPEKQAIVDLGQRMRIYMPYGELIPGMAYLVRRLLENTSNESFVRASFSRTRLAGEIADESRCRVSGSQQGQARQGAANAPGQAGAVRSLQACSLSQRAAGRFRGGRAIGCGCAMRWASVKAELGQIYPLWIDGQAVETNASLTSINPSRLCAGRRHRRRRRRRVMRRMPSPPHGGRCRPGSRWGLAGGPNFCCGAAESMRRRRFELAAWEVLECGKPWREADADVCEAIDFCEYYAAGGHRDGSAARRCTCRARRTAPSICRAAWRP